MAYKSSARGSRPVTLASLHSAEGARTAKSLASYFLRPDIMASAHDVVDADGIISLIDYNRASWTLRSGNPISDNLEICGFARWTRAQWLSTETVDGCRNPRAMVRWAGVWLARRARARGLPLRFLTIDEVRRGERGLIDHNTWTKAMRDGSHWDVGGGFPFDVALADAAQHLNPTEGVPDMDARQDQNLTNVWHRLDAVAPQSYFTLGPDGRVNRTSLAEFPGSQKNRLLTLVEGNTIMAALEDVESKVDRLLTLLEGKKTG